MCSNHDDIFIELLSRYQNGHYLIEIKQYSEGEKNITLMAERITKYQQ